MKELSYKAGEVIHKSGDIADTLEYVISGKVAIKNDSFSINAKKGSILGILEQAGTPYSYNYVAVDDVKILVYPFTRFSDANQIVEDQFSDCDTIITATANWVISLSSKYRQLLKAAEKFYSSLSRQYNRYKELCGLYGTEIQSFPFLEETSPFVPSKDMPDWINDYYDQLEIMPRETKNIFYGTHSALTTAAIWDAASHSKMYLSLLTQVKDYAETTIYDYFISNKADLFDLFNNLLTHKANSNNRDELLYEIRECLTTLIDDWDGNALIPEKMLENKKNEYQDIINSSTDLSEEDAQPVENSFYRFRLIENSLDTILKYANTDEAEDERFRQLVSQFKSLKDKNSNQDSVAELRKEITKSFIDIYESAIMTSFEDQKQPTILMMFFFFGYMDEDLIGKENALYLYDLVEKMQFDPDSGVYTIYDWLKSIYNGENEPSKNELDQDFVAYVKSQKASGLISDKMEERFLNSNKEKVRFEIRNFFKSAFKACSGRPASFCPILSNHNIIKSLETMYITPEIIMKNWNIIRAIDYSVFYRPCLFQSPEHRIYHESIILEVMPNVILMPLIGSRALLWQETADLRRDTPARIALPIFTDEDVSLLQLKLAGDFRWEMCKRVQGGRWNNVSERSLTSDYFDYLQFYKKNTNLSPDAKEKIRTQISNLRNNFKNIFISDYITWIRYESQGSPRLNKVVKNILFTYCPFSKGFREKLKNNPMYENMISRHEVISAKNLKNLTARYTKIDADLSKLPPEIQNFLELYKK